MKKCLLLLFASVAMLSACKKEDKKDNNDLKGSVWVYTEPGYTERLTFTSSDRFTYYENDEGDTETLAGTYMYNPPRIILETDYFSMSGKINGNKLIIDGEPDYVFTKR
ncbi:hypothetical protein [uncultured Rikenella sp.]|uniref:hypothetical protein n=1 Tax=uncultured Rikenella sp. TaxID=368003 RepID=UPI0025D28D2F|nr:hypothetical protein [uncultured Rikenella sp.]